MIPLSSTMWSHQSLGVTGAKLGLSRSPEVDLFKGERPSKLNAQVNWEGQHEDNLVKSLDDALSE